MVKKITFLLAAALLLMVNVCFAAGNGEKQKLHEELTQMIGDTGTKVPGMGVIVYKDGKEVFSDFLGSAIVDSNNPQNNRPFTRQSRFRVASVSKMFTVFTLMQLKET